VSSTCRGVVRPGDTSRYRTNRPQGRFHPAERLHPNVVLLDIMMPVMDGWAFLEELQTIPATERPRVIVVSARSSLRDRAKAAELGADAFVAKPFSVDDLMVVLHDIEQAV
jgi:CheY-like chemotaxis protein